MNLILNDGTYTYTYDAVGNRITRTKIADGTVTAYAWNNANQLLSVKTYNNWTDYSTGATPTSEVDYAYDPFGEMVSRNDGTTDQNFIYDGSNPVLVLNASGEVTRRNLYAAAVDQILASETVTPSSSPQAAGTVNWLLPDSQGTIRDVVQYASSATTEVDHLNYDSFGTIVYQTSIANQPSNTYAGMWTDTTTLLDKTAARWYDSFTSVFISQDPIGFNDGGTNLAMYCNNSTVNYTDPSGLSWSQYFSDYAYYFNNPDRMDPALRTTSKIAWGTATAATTLAGGAAIVEAAAVPGALAPAIGFGKGALVAGAAYATVKSAKNILDNKATAIDYVNVAIPVVVKGVGMLIEGLCFLAGTPVAATRGQVAIEEIRDGEEVWGFDLVANAWRRSRVKKTFAHEYVGALVSVTVASETIESTPSHPYWVVHGVNLENRPQSQHTENRPEGATTPGRWVDAGHLCAGDELLMRDGRIVPITLIERREFAGTVYNISVADLECYAVGSNNVLVHNKAATVIPVEEPLPATDPNGFTPPENPNDILGSDPGGLTSEEPTEYPGEQYPDPAGDEEGLPPEETTQPPDDPVPQPSTPTTPRGPVQSPGKYSNDSANYQKIPSGKPTKDGWWYEKYYRMTPEDAQAYRDATGDFEGQLTKATRWLPDAIARAWKFAEMRVFRTNWLKDFLDNRD